MEATALSRFLDKVHVGTGEGACWEWRASRDRKGYGKFKLDGKDRRAHRVSYEAFVGPIPEGLQLDHLCRNRACANPAHLEPVTNRTNTIRGDGPAVTRARHATVTHCPAGHEYTEANTYVAANGNRHCRTCGRDQQRMYRARQR